MGNYGLPLFAVRNPWGFNVPVTPGGELPATLEVLANAVYAVGDKIIFTQLPS